MRKHIKEQIDNIITVMKDAYGELKNLVQSGHKQEVLSQLIECQNGAISIGNAIEESEGEGFVTVKMLEEHCEAIYQMYTAVSEYRLEELDDMQAQLLEQLTNVAYSINNDIKLRKEVVFLPYKAAMWDSLESVWKAASEDEDCDAYVISIPYFDKNLDGTLGQMHYEGDLYPDDVPVMSYENYDFAERRPDIIFIHNPYDDGNRVTSVHPAFYSKRLKQFTEKLVYIPYFVLNEVNPEDVNAVKGVEEFILVSAAIHADVVIVQSEDMREVYIKVLTEFAGEETRHIWEDKILGLGSPKMDKVSSTKIEDIDIPDEWKQVMTKSDGSKKKVILYNTSVKALLTHKKQMLKKIESVLRTFEENKEEVTLLWRPHPLMRTTMESMCPELLELYEQIVQDYKTDGFGIFDESAELNRAIAVADAYYGDQSSVVKLCQEVGMPVMIQDVWCG